MELKLKTEKVRESVLRYYVGTCCSSVYYYKFFFKSVAINPSALNGMKKYFVIIGENNGLKQEKKNFKNCYNHLF